MSIGLSHLWKPYIVVSIFSSIIHLYRNFVSHSALHIPLYRFYKKIRQQQPQKKSTSHELMSLLSTSEPISFSKWNFLQFCQVT